MRELKGDDLFTLLAIVGKLGVEEEMMLLFEENVEETTGPQDHKKKKPTKAELARLETEAQRRGMKAVAGLTQKALRNIKDIKVEINDLLAKLTGEDVKTVENLSLVDYTKLITQFFKKPELRDFFTSIASLLQQ